jgi:hypothetical protein
MSVTVIGDCRYAKDSVSYLVRVVDVEVMFPSSNRCYVTVCCSCGSGWFVVALLAGYDQGVPRICFCVACVCVCPGMQNDDLQPGATRILLYQKSCANPSENPRPTY